MKVLIPESCIIWTNKGVCFPKDLDYGTEIFTIDPEDNLVTSPIIYDIEEPTSMKVNTIITENNICTFIPNYKIQKNNKILQTSQILNEKNISLVNLKHVKKFREFHDEHSVGFLERSPFSAMGALYLGSSGLKENKRAVSFEKSDEITTRKFAKNISDVLIPEFGGEVSWIQGVKNKTFRQKDASFLVLYKSDQFYKFRQMINLTEDKIFNSIYLNGLNIYFSFLRSLLTEGFHYHFNNYIKRWKGNKCLVLNIPWKSKIRKLLQNSCILWGEYQISTYKNKTHRNLDEVQIQNIKQYNLKQPILETKICVENCYEVEIPLGNKIILDNLIIKPFELTEEELEDLKTFEEEQEFNLSKFRQTLNNNGSPPFQTIYQTKKLDKPYGLHVMGVVKEISEIKESSTKYGKTDSINAILCDETGEIKMKLWGDIVKEIKNGSKLELVRAWIKNGTLYNSNKGSAEIH